MKVIVHDLQEKSWQELGMKLQKKDVVISEDKDCAGGDIEGLIGSCGQLVLISRCVYGGFSPFVQGVLERCRRRFGPCLEMRHGQTHYEVKSENRNLFGMICCFYGGAYHAEGGTVGKDTIRVRRHIITGKRCQDCIL